MEKNTLNKITKLLVSAKDTKADIDKMYETAMANFTVSLIGLAREGVFEYVSIDKNAVYVRNHGGEFIHDLDDLVEFLQGIVDEMTTKEKPAEQEAEQ